MNPISNPQYIATSASDPDAVVLRVRVSVIPEVEGRSYRSESALLVALRAFFRRLVDDSAYYEVSLRRETSVIFTANGPLIYQPGTDGRVQNGPARSSRK